MNEQQGIAKFFADQKAARGDKTPIVRPPELDDPKTSAARRQQVDDEYTERLLGRDPAVLTGAEQAFLRKKIVEALRSPNRE